MKNLFRSVVILCALSVLCETPVFSAPATQPATPPDPARVAQIKKMLADSPTGVGPLITNRPAWEKIAKLPAYKKLLVSADKFLKEPIPDQPDDLYLLFSKTGDRDQWQKVAFDRRQRFNTLVLAECVRNDGRYLPKITDYINALCAENTWTFPAHDAKLQNFHKEIHDIDLGDAHVGSQMATAYHLLGDKLDPAIQKLILDNLNLRVIEPFREVYTGKRLPWFWINGTNNWTAVCLAGTLGTCLAITPDKHTRAEFIAAAELYSKNFLAGFPTDGYCTEGLGYWNYGFGNYVSLSEVIRQSTGGQIDLLARKEAALPAHFGPRIQIINDVAPAFADCPVDAKPSHQLMWYLNEYFSMGLPAYSQSDDTSEIKDVFAEAIYRFDNAASQAATKPKDLPPAPYLLRDYFSATGILIARPALNSTCKIGVALKGGNNNEHHNHNDVGSYVVVLNDRPVILDPGGERYTARTFSAHRYDSKLLNSWGHDVPLVAGQLQRTGAEAQAKILKNHFTDTTDELSLDITSCYAVPELQSLTRSWTYSRAAAGSLTITDEAKFKSPQSFGTALITLGKWSRQPDGKLLIDDKGQALVVTINATGDYTIDDEIIKENAVNTPTRIGINLKEKATSARITLTVTPR